MLASQQWLDVTANNLANASTNGFKADGMVFRETMMQQLSLANGTNIGSLGAGMVSSAEYTDFDMGAISGTGNPLDMAIDNQRGAFAVETPQGTRYTRDGAFELNADGQLVNKSGFPVLDTSGRPISVGQGELRVEKTGEIFVNNNQVAQVGIYDGAFKKDGQNLFSSDNAQLAENVSIRPRSLEGSNVNPVESMISMITINRNFEMAQKSTQQQDELTQRLIQSLQGQ